MRPLEPTVLGRLYRQHAPALLLYARQWGGAAEDHVQTAFVRLAQQAPPPEQVLPWLYRVVRNETLSHRRSAARCRDRERRASTPEAWFDSAEERLAGGEVSPRPGNAGAAASPPRCSPPGRWSSARSSSPACGAG